MPSCSVDQTEAVRRYYAAFPALKKGQESPLQYYLPPPAWCRKSDADQKLNMQSELSMISKDWNSKKKFSTGKERRNSYHGQRKSNKKRCNSYSRSFESKESLPEWVTHEGVWDMDTQDPVKEFIRAIALDEGYGTCENTVTDELKEIAQVKFRLNENMVPAWDDSLDLDTEWVINDDLNPRVRTPMEDEMYAKFEAKFDRSIEALWKDQNTPDDEYQDLPIDFQDLLSSPSDNLFADPSVEKSMMSLTESIWSNASERESPSRLAEALHDRLRPLQLAEAEAEAGAAAVADPADSFAVYSEVDIYDAAENVACTMRSLTAINHSRDRSGFVEVPPRAAAAARLGPADVGAHALPPHRARRRRALPRRRHLPHPRRPRPRALPAQRLRRRLHRGLRGALPRVPRRQDHRLRPPPAHRRPTLSRSRRRRVQAALPSPAAGRRRPDGPRRTLVRGLRRVREEEAPERHGDHLDLRRDRLRFLSGDRARPATGAAPGRVDARLGGAAVGHQRGARGARGAGGRGPQAAPLGRAALRRRLLAPARALPRLLRAARPPAHSLARRETRPARAPLHLKRNH